jgi:phosphatidylcholine synthase
MARKPKSSKPKSARVKSPEASVPPARRALAFSVHLLTAAGAAIALFALVAAIAGEFTAMFAFLGLALLIDGIDGMFARRLRVAALLPRWSGDALDLIVDFLNYVFVPAIALASGAIVPQRLALPAAVAIVISSAIYFSDTRMKTADGYFRGFPALWNVVIFYLFVIQPAPVISLVVVSVFVILTFMPIEVAHPLRARHWRRLNIALLLAWTALAFAAIAYHLSPPPYVTVGLLVTGAYFLGVGFLRPQQRIA